MTIFNSYIQIFMADKQEILEEITRITMQNGGKPLGISKFEKETGITEWRKFWPRFGDALTEAGFTPNKLTGAYPDEFLIEMIIGLARKIQRFPTSRELMVEHHANTDFPDSSVYGARWSKQDLVKKVIEYCKSRSDLNDILSMCDSVLEKQIPSMDQDSSASRQRLGEVYLFKSGRFYKIGKTFDTVRRGSELKIQLPEELNLIHSIKTDDPSGVEAYWHRRFDSKRMNGEWFDLSSSEIKAFKLWKRIC